MLNDGAFSRNRKITLNNFVGHQLFRAADAHRNGVGITLNSYFSGQFEFAAPTRQSYSETRSKVSWELFEWILESVVTPLPRRLWFGHSVKTLDGTQVRLPHTEELIETFGRLKSQHGFNHYPSAQMLLLKDAFSYQPLAAYIGRCDISEKVHALELLESLKPNDVVLLDRGLGGQNIYKQLGDSKVFFVHRATIGGARIARYLKVFLESGAGSYVGHVGPLDQEPLLLRLIRGQLENGETIVYVTNLTDEVAYSNQDIHELYDHRWNIEISHSHYPQSENLYSAA